MIEDKKLIDPLVNTHWIARITDICSGLSKADLEVVIKEIGSFYEYEVILLGIRDTILAETYKKLIGVHYGIKKSWLKYQLPIEVGTCWRHIITDAIVQVTCVHDGMFDGVKLNTGWPLSKWPMSQLLFYQSCEVRVK